MTSAAPQVLCIGFGALGTIYSYLLERGGAQVTAVARSNYTALTTSGIQISSAKYGEIAGWKPHRAVRESEPSSACDRDYDFVVCTFKNVPDHKSASSIIRPFLRSGSLPAIVLLQNGVDIEEEVHRSLVRCDPPVASAVLSAVAWIGANLADAGSKVVHGALERLEMGVYPAPTRPLLDDGRRKPSEQDQKALEAFAAIYAAGGGGGEAVEDIEAVRWKKVLWNAAWGGLSTLARQPVSTLLLDETLHYSVGVVRRTMLEIVYVARACGLNETRFPMAAVDNAVNITLSTSSVPGVQDPAKGGNLAPAFKPSILLDLENGRPMELEVIIGNIVRQARRHNVDTPRLDLILATLKLNQIHAIRAAKERDGSEGEQSGDAVTTFSQLKATSRGNWPAGAPVSQNPHTYL